MRQVRLHLNKGFLLIVAPLCIYESFSCGIRHRSIRSLVLCLKFAKQALALRPGMRRMRAVRNEAIPRTG